MGVGVRSSKTSAARATPNSAAMSARASASSKGGQASWSVANASQ